MAEADDLRELAGKVLCTTLPGRKPEDKPGKPDQFVLEHSIRVWNLAQQICLLPELADRRIDRGALQGACLFHDAGWIAQWRAGRIEPWQLLANPTSDQQRRAGADLLLEMASQILEPRQLTRAAQAIRDCNLRSTDLIEAQILSESENLEEIGAIGIWRLARKCLAQGRSIADMLSSWSRQQEYHYWEARVNEGLQFDFTKRLAQQRLARMEQFMAQLADESQLQDFSELAAGPSTIISGERANV